MRKKGSRMSLEENQGEIQDCKVRKIEEDYMLMIHYVHEKEGK
jgi:hypothetical protein